MDDMLVRVAGIIRPTQTQEITAEAATYAEARELILGNVPDGWQLVYIRTDASQRRAPITTEPPDE